MAIKARHVFQFGAFRLDVTDRLLYREGELLALVRSKYSNVLRPLVIVPYAPNGFGKTLRVQFWTV